MKKRLSLFVCSALFCFASCSIKQVEYSQRTITVSGHGTITVDADTATIVTAVITHAKDVMDASNQNAAKMNDIQKALTENGISKDNITTENYSLYQESRYDSKRGESIPGDYRVTNQIKVTVKDISKIGEIIDLCLKSGANSLSSISYGVTNPEIAAKQARTLAIQQAQESAGLLAGASGAMLGKVLKITEMSTALPKTRTLSARASAENDEVMFSKEAATPVANAKSTVTVNVEAVYQLK